MQIKNLSFCIALLLLFASCKEDPVINDAGYYSNGKDGVYFISENILTVTSSKSGGGISTRSGYSTQYISAVNAETGETLKRIKTGESKEQVEYLGMAGGKAWFFSHDPKLGVHSRDPQTLAVIDDVNTIIGKNEALKTGITEQAYENGIDSSGRFLVLTSKDGYNYLVDPASLHAAKTDDKVKRRYYAADKKSYAGNLALNDTLEIDFRGTPRRSLVLSMKKFDPNSYAFYSRNDPKREVSKSLYYKSTGSKEYPDISFIDPSYMADNLSPCGQEERRNPLLRDGNTIFILSKSMLGTSYSWLISAIKVSYTDGPVVLWQYEIDKTDKVHASDKEFVNATFTGKSLLLAFENTCLALDVATGKLKWRKNVKTKSG